MKRSYTDEQIFKNLLLQIVLCVIKGNRPTRREVSEQVYSFSA